MKEREIDWKSIPSAVTDEDVVREMEKLEEWAGKASEILDCSSLAIEIGSYLGRSTVLLAQFFYVIAIDLWGTGLELGATSEINDYKMVGLGKTWPLFLSHMRKFDLLGFKNKNPIVSPICSTSEALNRFPNLAIPFAFVDAEHTYPAAYWDLRRVSRHVAKGGMIALHDYRRPGWLDPDPWIGNAQSVDRFLEEGYGFRLKEHFLGIVCLERVE